MKTTKRQTDAAAAQTRHAPVSVLCVDDNRDVAEALRLKLEQVGGFDWKGSLISADELVSTGQSVRPHVIILDIDMPGRSPFEALAELVELCPETRAIMFSGHVRFELIDRALDAGAWGYVSKNDGEDALVKALRDVAKDELALSHEVQLAYQRRPQ